MDVCACLRCVYVEYVRTLRVCISVGECVDAYTYLCSVCWECIRALSVSTWIIEDIIQGWGILGLFTVFVESNSCLKILY